MGHPHRPAVLQLIHVRAVREVRTTVVQGQVPPVLLLELHPEAADVLRLPTTEEVRHPLTVHTVLRPPAVAIHRGAVAVHGQVSDRTVAALPVQAAAVPAVAAVVAPAVAVEAAGAAVEVAEDKNVVQT